jgi:hypothetical protein
MITDNASFWLALWGAVLSTALAVIKGLEFRANRGRLHLDLIWQPGDAGRDGHVHYSMSAANPALRVTNKGQRKVRVVEAGACRSGRGKPAYDTSGWFGGLPATLDEGESVVVQGGRFSDWIINVEEVRALFVRDSLGREWVTGRRAIQKFRREGRPSESRTG